MSNRIEEAIRKILFTRKQHDILLEQIIKQALLEGKTVAKIKDATKAEQQAGKQAGAVVVYAVVMRNVSEQNISQGVRAATESVGLKDPNKKESKQIDIGPNSIYATTTKEYIADPIKLKQSNVRIRGEYKYFIGNINKTGNRIRCVVWIIPMKLWEQYEQFVHSDEYYQNVGDSVDVEGRTSISFGSTQIDTMKSWIQRSEKRASDPDLDRKWYIEKNGGEIKPLPPESWYNFAGLRPAQAVALGTDAQTNSDTDQGEVNVQDDIVEVTDKKLKNGGTFSGIWNNTKSIPVNGTVTSTNGDQYSGDFSYDAASNNWWLSKGIRIANNGEYTEQGTFDQSGKFLEGTVSNTTKNATDNTKTIWKFFYVGGNVDTTNNKSTATIYDASNKVISFYEGTMDKDVKPYTGTQYSDDTKTTKVATFVKGEYISK